ncbi:MAG: hypothetical protein HKN16_09800 [Saprospiraceae bacterium]|nr:hypothetical protein [Saprospiraceae bacterium]
MKTKTLFAGIVLLAIASFLFLKPQPAKVAPDHCVFNNLFGIVDLDPEFKHAPTEAIESAIRDGLDWLEKAQHPDGGWGAGFNAYQKEMDPHKVPADPATTAMVSMALLRTGSTLEEGPHQKQLKKATEYLLNAVEDAIPNGAKITDLTGTQIQSKLGQNIDLVLTTQYLTNLLDELDNNSSMYKRVFNSVNKSVDMVQTSQDDSGRTKGAGWAGVLQSSFATSALEAAQARGAYVDGVKLTAAKSYQKSNYDPVTESVEVKDGAGIMLYSVSSSVRSSAKEARRAKKLAKKAQEAAGVLDEVVVVNYENLRKAGVEEEDAIQLETAYKVYESAKVKAQEKRVVSGFGNNGGEEFLSFLQTGESMVIANDNTWKNWYDSMSANLLNIQNNDGSWNGHHCITSPVFCTATCLLILSINNDIDQLVAQGEE